MNINPLNYKIHGTILGALILSGGFSFIALNRTFSEWEDSRLSARAHRQEIVGVERDAEQTQAAIDNHINLYDSVTITGYVCDPESAPKFDVAAFVKDEVVDVADQNQRVIGYIEPSGNFVFLPKNCK